MKWMLVFFLSFSLNFAYSGEREDVMALVKKAADAVNEAAKKGQAEVDKVFKQISDPNDPTYRNGTALYIYVYTMEGDCVAHGFNPKMVGKNLVKLQDPDGKYFNKGLIDTAAAGGGWYDFKFINPDTKKIGQKHGYALKADKYTVGSGYYDKE